METSGWWILRKRFLLAMPRRQNAKDAFIVVMNWPVGLKHIVGVRRVTRIA